jgi:chaperone modulatory protein CbpM
MRVDLTEVIWFEPHALSLPELAEISRLPRPVLEELFEYGAIEPIESTAPEPRFGAPALRIARAASRLREDFELETQALAVVLSLLDRVEELRAQLQDLQARQPHVHR